MLSDFSRESLERAHANAIADGLLLRNVKREKLSAGELDLIRRAIALRRERFELGLKASVLVAELRSRLGKRGGKSVTAMAEVAL